jgi:mercuric ion transport protein
MSSDIEKPRGAARYTSGRPSVIGAPTLLSGGGLLAALAASSCCMMPLALFGLGISGAWIGTLTRLAPYHPYFLGVAMACLGIGYWRVWHPRTGRTDGEACASACRSPGAVVMTGLVLATVLVAGALAFDLVLPLFLH